MEDKPVAMNSICEGADQEITSHTDAIKLFAKVLSLLDEKLTSHWWQLSGDDANSICRLIDVDGDTMVRILRLCNILHGPNDNFRVRNFEMLMEFCGLDWSIYRPTAGVMERCIKVGRVVGSLAVSRPKDMYSEGMLAAAPEPGVHMPTVRTKQFHSYMDVLMSVSKNCNDQTRKIGEEDAAKPTKRLKHMLSDYVSEILDAIKEEVQAAGCAYHPRLERQLCRLLKKAVKQAGFELFEAAVDSLGGMGDTKKTHVNPDSTVSTDTVATSPAVVPITPRQTSKSGAAAQSLVTPSTINVRAARADIDITTPTTCDDDAPEGLNAVIDPFIKELMDETLLQNLLHRKAQDSGGQRAFELEHKNGRKLRVVLPPDSHSPAAFAEDAKKTGWVNSMLHTSNQQDGMLLYFARTKPKTYARIGRQRRLDMSSTALDTTQTVAMARMSLLNDTQLKKIRSFLRHVGNVKLSLSEKELRQIDSTVGINDTEPSVTFASHVFEWALSSAKGKEKRPPEHCEYWNADVLKEIAVEVDLHLQHKFDTEQHDIVPNLDYNVMGFDKKVILILFGGDHGDKACPISAKINFTSPQERKRRGKINYQCPTIQIASIDCSKDAFGLLQATVMPQIREQLIQLQSSIAITIYDCKEPTKKYKTLIVPDSIDRASLQFNVTSVGETQQLTMTYQCHQGAVNNTVDLSNAFDNAVHVVDLRSFVVISKFHDLFVGDLAFQAMLVGMTNSSGAWCLQCRTKAAQFNTDELGSIRNKPSLSECLNEYNTQMLQGKSANNVDGVNSIGLLDVDPQRLLVPMLHCPMGLVDKVLESFKTWINLHVEELGNESNQIRDTYVVALQATSQATSDLHAAKATHDRDKTIESRDAFQAAKKAKSEARKVEKIAKSNYDEMIQRHNARKDSLAQRFEPTCRQCGIKREHYHGGKFNGVNCIRIMEKAEQLFDGDTDHKGFVHEIKRSKLVSVSDIGVETTCNLFARLLGLLDVVWSSVRGIDSGLLPTEEQVVSLEKTLADCKTLWKQMDLSTLQPKWHLTFDGHLLHQIRKHGGLADKADDTIELEHQKLKRLRDRHRSIPSFKRRETCIRKEIKRQRSAGVKKHFEDYKTKISKLNRKRGAAVNLSIKREQKRIKREAVAHNNG